jgi:ABC-type xylose transport system substrate-binding protein
MKDYDGKHQDFDLINKHDLFKNNETYFEKNLKKIICKKNKINQDEKLEAIILNLNNIIAHKEKDMIMMHAGSSKLIDELEFYFNKVLIRESQIISILKIGKKMISFSESIVKKIPNRKKFAKRKAKKYLKHMKRLLKETAYLKRIGKNND